MLSPIPFQAAELMVFHAAKQLGPDVLDRAGASL